MPFGKTQFPLWVYTGPVNEQVHQVPGGPPGTPGNPADTATNWKFIQSPAADIKPDPKSGLCPDGSKPNLAGVCPQPGSQTAACTTDYVCADEKSPLWDGTTCTCADGSAPRLKTDKSTPPGGSSCADGSTPDPTTGMCNDGTCPGGGAPVNGSCLGGGGGGGACPDGSARNADGSCRPPMSAATTATPAAAATLERGGGGGGGASPGGGGLSDMVQQILSGGGGAEGF